jgi:conjugal transfer mating pair stabilization protein TraN
MRGWGLVALYVWFCTSAVCAQAPDAHREGIAAGQSANVNAKARVTDASTREVIPGVSDAAQTAAQQNQDRSSAAVALRLQSCQSRPRDPACVALLAAQSSANVPKPSLQGSASNISNANRVSTDPYSLVQNLTASYSACTPQTVEISPAVYDRQSCHTYLLRELDQACGKVLTVTVDYQCPADATLTPGPSNAPPVCRRTVNGVTTTVVATAIERDSWSSSCGGLESRVPPGLLPPDGVNTIPILAGSLDIVNKCERKSSVCTDPAATRTINGKEVTRACWQYANAFDCVSANEVSDCDASRLNQSMCQASGSQTCTDYDTFFATPVCTAYRSDFQCQVRPAVTQTAASCAGQNYCVNGKCFDASYQNDADFARTVATLEASRQAGRYLEASGMQIFGGFDNRCVKKLFGLVNCCNKGGTGALGAFANMAVLIASGQAIGGAVASTYTYDGLFASDAPNFVINGFQSMFGTGGSSAFAGLLAGDVSVSGFLGTLVPGPWTVAMLAIQYSGLLSCPEREKVVAMKRDANLCVDLGSYCSRRLPIIRTCLEQTQSFCCFNSKLARILNVQGKAQSGRGLGTAQNPQCGGFSIEEFQALDFSRIDMSEFYADIVPTIPDAANLASRLRSGSSTCAAASGRCGP